MNESDSHSGLMPCRRDRVPLCSWPVAEGCASPGTVSKTRYRGAELNPWKMRRWEQETRAFPGSLSPFSSLTK